MTISVHHAVAIPPDDPLFPHALPEGFPLLVIDEQSKIIEPVLLYQLDKLKVLGIRNWRKKRNTVMATAFDLRDWFDYLAHVEWENPISREIETGKPWDLATESDYISWRDTASETIRPKTNRRLADSTIARRQGAVEKFYKAAQRAGWYTGEFVITKIKKGRDSITSHSIPDNNSSHRLYDDDGISKYRQQVGQTEPVRPFTVHEWSLLKDALGPLPSETDLSGISSRDRLASELSLGTGMRVDEVASLTEFQFHALYKAWQATDEEDRESGFVTLRITKTKRLKARDVKVPCYIIPELAAYFDGERKTSIEIGRALANVKGTRFKAPTSLFVNRTDAGVHAGKPVSAATLSWEFKKSCLRAGLVHYVEKFDIGTEESYREALSKHRYHDLRHTFAVWKYHELLANGDPEPWKEVQILLGHSSLRVTLDTYLAVTSVERRNAGAAQYAAKKQFGENYA